jgi:hypothetical protein
VVFDRSHQTKTLVIVAASADDRGSRLPTRAESGKRNVPITPLNLGQLKAAPLQASALLLRSLRSFAAIIAKKLACTFQVCVDQGAIPIKDLLPRFEGNDDSGYTSLWLATAADTGATLIVIAAALRLL